MRRYWMMRFQPVSRRSGVIASVTSRNRSAQMPVVELDVFDRVDARGGRCRTRERSASERHEREDEDERLAATHRGS